VQYVVGIVTQAVEGHSQKKKRRDIRRKDIATHQKMRMRMP
jgi:hypothetical protein